MNQQRRIQNVAIATLVLFSTLLSGVVLGATPGKAVRIGAVAYSPSAVTIFEGIKRYLNTTGYPADYVLYSNYDSLVDALSRGEIEIAWNTPLAHAKYHVQKGDSQTLVMRDVDFGFRAVLVARVDSGISSLEDLRGKGLVLGSCGAAEATVLPKYFLTKEGIDCTQLKVLDLDKEVDFQGNPCCSPEHVLAAVQSGRGDAGIISEHLWNAVREGGDLRKIWTSPPFSHCVFTAAPDFDEELGARFTDLMTKMSVEDPSTAEVMQLEGARKWRPGSPDGFVDLVRALKSE